MFSSTKESAVTLIKLLVIKAIVAILAAGLFPLDANAQGLPDLWSGRARCVIENRALGASFGMHFIATVPENPSTLLTYYIANNSQGSATGFATTRDGITFTNFGTVVFQGPQSWDNRLASFPGIAKLDSTRYALLYEGAGHSSAYPGDIGLALSNNGRTFTKDANPILIHGQRQPNDNRNLNLDWERKNIGTPSLVVVGDTRYLFYHGFGKSWSGGPDDCQVGVATGTDLRNMTRYPGNPVLRTGDRGSWDAGSIGRRSIRKGNDGWWYAVYEGSGDQPYEKARWSTGLARSRDLLNWTKFPGNPIMPLTISGFGYDGPEIVEFNGKTYLYFRNTNGATYRAIVSWR